MKNLVLLEEEKCGLFNVEQGVAQGCSLSSILFSVFNDLLKEVELTEFGVQLSSGIDSIDTCLYYLCSLVPQTLLSGIGSGNIVYIELFQRNSIIATSIRKASLMFHNHVKNVKTPVHVIIII